MPDPESQVLGTAFDYALDLLCSTFTSRPQR
jgi:hypothetical protein